MEHNNNLLDVTTIHKTLRRSKSETLFSDQNSPPGVIKEAKVLVIYTGGTIGMIRNNQGALVPHPNELENKLRSTITLHDQAYANERFKDFLVKRTTEQNDVLLPLVLPEVPNHKKVMYAIHEYDPLLDSSNMTMDDWIQIASDIQDSYTLFDGFVVLHGTDTLAYTASALSFMLENLGKPVIITGSQIPCFETRSDGRDNLVGALILAGNYNIPEVTVYFRHQLMRGNRTVKVSSGDLNAFTSPNMSPLVNAGIDFEVDHRAIFRPGSIQKFRVHKILNRNVVLLRLFPSIRSDTVAHFLKAPIEGVVLQCYGSGNVPHNRQDIMTCINEATKRGVIIISVTQCTNGAVSGLYATGKALLEAGVILGNDLTPEAALTKLSYVLSKSQWNLAKKREMMQTNLVGEMTVMAKSVPRKTSGAHWAKEDMQVFGAIGRLLHLNTSEELQDVEKVLSPSILCAAVQKSDLATLQHMTSNGINLSLPDYDRRTPLHIAASEGNVEITEFLLKFGSNLHVRDRANDTPLNNAINGGHEDVIRLLINCGAHLNMSKVDLGELLCFLARKGDQQKLHCYHLAGANMNSKNLSLCTPLHMAVESGQDKVIKYLISIGVEQNVKNLYGQTPRDVATLLGRVNALNLLDSK